MHTETFLRFHHADAPAFTADNAWSAPWGSEFTEDGTSFTCLECDGTGESDPRDHHACDSQGCWYCDDTGWLTECEDCDGEGTLDCDRGYSSCWDATALTAYFTERHATPADDHGTVYVFEGELSGAGCDGEPLAVPTRIVETLTWSQLVARAAQEEATQ